MLVYFSANARDINNDIKSYRSIVACVQRYGGIMVHNWIEIAAHRGKMPVNDMEWWDGMPSEAIVGVRDADVFVVEATGQGSLGVGFEMAMALIWDKPVLALVNKEFEGGSYVQGIRHPHLSVYYYDRHNLEDIVRRFLNSLSSGL